jgi:hypothetical protein
MRPAYGFYTLLTFLIPGISSGTLFSMTRYTLMLVPAFMVLARWGRVAWVDRVVLGLSLPIMGYLAVTFSHNYPPV